MCIDVAPQSKKFSVSVLGISSYSKLFLLFYVFDSSPGQMLFLNISSCGPTRDYWALCIYGKEISTLGKLVPMRLNAKWCFTLHTIDYCSQVDILNVMWLCCPPVAAPWGVQILVMPAGSRDPFTRSPPYSTCCSWPHMDDFTSHLNGRNEQMCSTKVFWTFFSLQFHPRVQKK